MALRTLIESSILTITAILNALHDTHDANEAKLETSGHSFMSTPPFAHIASA